MHLVYKRLLGLLLTSMTIILSGCQNIQMAESPIPVTADFHSILKPKASLVPSNSQHISDSSHRTPNPSTSAAVDN